MRARAGLVLLGTLAVAGPACSTLEEQASVQLPGVRAPDADLSVARAVGDLLSPDVERSAAGERALLSLDEAGQAALERQARRIPDERDPRWLHVLDERASLPPMPDAQRVAFLAWKAGRPETSFAMKARAALAQQARTDPAPLYDVVAAGGPGVEAVAVALTMAGRRDAAPRLLARYVESEDEDERRALAEAAARLTGAERPPRVNAPREERAREARRVLLALEAEPAAPRHDG